MLQAAVIWMIIGWLDGVSSENVPQGDQQRYWSDRFSIAFHLLLPAAGLGFLLFGKKHIFPKLLVQIDRNCISVFCPSLSKREKLLKWACQKLPSKWSSHSSKTLSGGVAELWSDGSLLCTLINTAIPGACPNPHRHWKQPPSHAQAIAYKYLDVAPIFGEKELAGNLTSNLEMAFIHYLGEIQQSINKITGNIDVERIFCSEYIARGLGLFSGEQHRQTVFYVYPDDFENSKPCENSVIINIKGPFGTYGHATISRIQNSSANRFDEDSDITNNTNTKTKSVFLKKIPWFSNNSKKLGLYRKSIEIEVTLEKNRAKVSYIPNDYGMHEINLICNGELLKGCPFNVHIFSNDEKSGDISKTGEKNEGLRHYQKRKIISTMVDLIDENIPFSELEEKYHISEGNIIMKKEPLKSTFNFREVVEEITKNDDIFKDIFKVGINDNNCEKLNILNIQQSAENNEEIDIQFDKLIEVTETNDDGVLEETDGPDSFQKYDVENKECFENDAKLQELNDLGQSWEPDYNVEIEMPVIDEMDEAPDLSENLDKGDKKAEYTSEKKIDIVIGQKNTQNSLECIGERNLLSKIQDNYEGSSKQTTISASDHSTKIKHENDSMFNVNKMNIEHQLDVGEKKSQIFSKYINTNINKLKIPVKFLESKRKITTGKLNIEVANTKYFQDTQHESTIKNNVIEKNEDLNNNNIYIEETKLKQSFDPKEIGEETEYQSQEYNNLVPCFSSQIKDTSPICPDHIVHEVEYSKVSVAEKRKIFAQNSSKSIYSSKDSSFSEKESVEGSERRHYQIVGLSVLNVLDSLKKSIHLTNDESFSLSNTVSLPNISFESNNVSSNVVREKKTYWEKLQMSSSTNSRSSLPKNTITRIKLSDEKKNKSTWKMSYESNESDSTKTDYIEKNMYKSADDILTMTKSLNHQTSSRGFKSVDDFSDEYEMLTIEERKQMLLKQHYAEEKLARNRMMLLRIGKQSVSLQDMRKDDQLKQKAAEKQDIKFISPVTEKIRKFNSVSSLSVVKREIERKMKPTTFDKDYHSLKVVSSKPSITEETDSNIVSSKPEPKIRYKSQFNRAIKYFKRLEEKSQGKPKSKISKKSKQFSLDIRPKRDKNRKRGGSLSISERFSINNLYEDITQNKKGSLKGTPNRTALVEALATFSRRENHYYNFCENEDEIKYDIFKNNGKIKKRKSLKSIFDVYY